MVVTGATTEVSLQEAIIHYYTRICRAIPQSIRAIGCLNVRIQNIVAYGYLGSHIDLPKAYLRHNVGASYQPEIFPGIRFKIPEPQTKALVFLSGKAVITGIRGSEEVQPAWKALCDTMRPFFTDTHASHVEVVANRQRQRATLVDELGGIPSGSHVEKKLKSAKQTITDESDLDDIALVSLSSETLESDDSSDDELFIGAAFDKIATL